MFFIYFEEINNMNYNKSLLSILIIAIMLCIGISPLKGAEERLFKKDGKEKKQIVVEEGSESEGEEGSEFEEEPTAKRQLTKNKTAAQKRIEAAKKRKEEAAKSRSQKKMTVEKGTSAKKQPTKNKTAAQKRIEAAKKRKEEVAKSRGQKTTGKTTTTVSQKNIQKIKGIFDQCKQNILKKLSALNDKASQSVGNELWERSMGNGEKNDFIACLEKNLPGRGNEMFKTFTKEEVKDVESFMRKTVDDIYKAFLKKGFTGIKNPNSEKKPEPESSGEKFGEKGSEFEGEEGEGEEGKGEEGTESEEKPTAKKQPTKNKTAAQKRIEAAKKRKEEALNRRGQKTTGKTTTTVSQNPEKKPEPESSGEESSGEGSESEEEGDFTPFQARLDKIKNDVIKDITGVNINPTSAASATSYYNRKLKGVWTDMEEAGFTGKDAKGAVTNVISAISDASKKEVDLSIPWYDFD